MPMPKRFDRAEAERLYRSGLGVIAVANILGCTESPVRRALKKIGVQMREPSRRAFDPAAAAKMYLEGCSTPAISRSLGASVPSVQAALRQSGITLRSISEARHLNAKPTRVNAYGYVMVRTGPKRYRLQHRVIAEAALGRKLRRFEYVHHINADRADNRPENLLICTHAYHEGLHARMDAHPYWQQFTKRKE